MNIRFQQLTVKDEKSTSQKSNHSQPSSQCDPTSHNKQGYDTGPEYRSAIFYHTEEQKSQAEASKKHLGNSQKYDKPIVTEIVPFTTFYEAEEENQNFYESGKRPDYCTLIID